MRRTENEPSNRGEFSVGEAKQVLDSTCQDLLSCPGVTGVGVGYRDNETRVFIVTVKDAAAKADFQQWYRSQEVGDLPLEVDISCFCETSCSVRGRRYDPAVYRPQRGLWARLAHRLTGVRSLLSP